MCSYLHNYTISFELCTLFQKLVQRVVKKETSSMKVHYMIPLNYRMTGLKIKLNYFQERLNLRYKIILKLLSLFHACF